MVSSGITRAEWLTALHEAGMPLDEHDERALTVSEFATMFHTTRFTAQRNLEQLVAAGKAEPTRKWGSTVHGRRVQFKAYRLTGQKTP